MDKKVLEFVIFCVESLAEQMKMSAKDVYKLVDEDTHIYKSILFLVMNRYIPRVSIILLKT
ncbi:hypothetical protein SH2C18_23170 [Clostridium sediminicola]